MSAPAEFKMKKIITQLLLLSLMSAGLLNQAVVAQQSRAENSPETLISNATVITITNGTLPNTDVLIRKGKISAIGKSLKAPANARVIDATGKYLMPGIIDCHSHSMLDTINEGTLAVTSMARTRDV